MAEKTVRYNFRATGQQEVVAAYRSVTQAALDMANAVGKAGRMPTMRSAVSGIEKGYATAARGAKQAEAAMAREEKAAAKAAAAKVREEQKAAKQIERIQAAAAKQAERSLAKQTRDAEKAAADRVRAEQRANEKIREQRARTLGKLSDGVGGVATLAAGAGVALVGAAARESIQTRELANRVAINAKLGGGSANADEVNRNFERVALNTPGINSRDVGSAALAFQSKTGKVADAQELQTFATVASAAGAKIEDVASAAAALSNQFDVKGVDQFREALGALVVQGAKGSFELKDAATQFDKMAAAAKRFGLDKGPEGAKVLGGLSQIARSSTGSSEQAASAVEASLRQLVSKSGELKSKYGVDVFQKGTGNTKARDVQDVLVETIAGAKGNLPKLQGIFGEEGIRGISPLISTFNGARNAATGTEAEKTAAGIRALREALAGAIEAPNAWATTVEAATGAQKDSSAQLSAAWERVKEIVAAQVVPALLPMAEKLPELTPLLGLFVDALGVALDAILEFAKLIPGVNTEAIEKAQRKSAINKELRTLDPSMTGISGPLNPEDQDRMDRLKAELAGEPGLSVPGMGGGNLTTKGGVYGAAAGGAVFGATGAVVGGALGAATGAGSQAQGEQYAKDFNLDSMAAGGKEAATALKGLKEAVDIAAPALKKLAAANQPSILG